MKEERRTIIIYESPHRIVKTLNDILMFFGNDRMMSISREMTKIYEETSRGSIKYALDHFKRELPKGEFVLCISGKSSK